MNLRHATTSVAASLHRQSSPQPDGERELVRRLVQVAVQSGVEADAVTIVNCYVALKSKPLAILAGPVDSGKVALVQSLAQVLVGPACWRCQVMLGHAWWAASSTNVAVFTEAQARFVAIKVFDLVADALHPENASQVFMGCLAHISPAELAGFFSEVAFQLGHGQLMQLPSFHLNEPIPYPPNLFLVGTMDTDHFHGWDNDLLSQATVVLWPTAESPAQKAVWHGALPGPLGREAGCWFGGAESCFLGSSVRTERAAFGRLHSVRGWQPALMQPLWQIDELLKDYGVRLPEVALSEALIYVANAWSRQGQGLFEPAMGCNLLVALDLAILQTLLVRAADGIGGSGALRSRMMALLGTRFSRSAAFVSSI